MANALAYFALTSATTKKSFKMSPTDFKTASHLVDVPGKRGVHTMAKIAVTITVAIAVAIVVAIAVAIAVAIVILTS